MIDKFEDSFSEFSKDEDMMFCKDVILSQAGELHDTYKYIYDFHRQHPCEELAVVLRYVELARIGLENAYDVLDNKLFDKSEAQDYTWIPSKD
ncbi:hypothetical protein [Aeromonas phage 4L372D]|uniref:Uncharacterized protein n=2 Tax=Plateaulakevirus TaxID=2843436 RepID=A0A5B9N563_9CAUD|nr:hypothetical protein HWC25_gp147 [Aeromonas phage 2L372D]YP_009846713.1 hypothetical protein HWC27_gp226 [Aeromonas phage 4L372D]QDB74061.1 hypothetical protein 2L372D_147 [Aeromonas phage 2L372D]QEG08629.1 hypothetical protein [Aeromonas phage 4L372D]